MRTHRYVATTVTALLVSAFAAWGAAPAGAQATAPTEMFYAVVAHPDDEAHSWGFIEKIESEGLEPDGVPAAFSKSGTYTVFVTLTHGEGTTSCWTADDAAVSGSQLGEEGFWVEGFDSGETRTGPYKYQGPDSPVGEPDLSERHPLGDPWQGMDTQACKDARIASWHWFLDDMNELDGSGTDMDIVDDPRLDDDYVGLMCEPGHQGRGRGRPLSKQVGCADVWANEEGARVAFDLGNCCSRRDGSIPPSDFTEEKAVAALTLLRDRRAEWGLPVLPQRGIFAAVGYCTYNDPENPDPTLLGDHPDHVLVSDTIFQNDLGMGTRYGIVYDCPSDNFLSADERLVIPPDPATLFFMDYVEPVTEKRAGPFNINYGWLFATYYFPGGFSSYWQQKE